MGGGGEKAWGGRTGGFGGRSSGGSFDGGLINPAGIPGPDLDGDLIRDVARGLETFRDSVRAALGQAKTAWTGLSSALTGDGLEVLHTGLDSPAANADDVADRFGQVAAMLRIFAATVDDVKPKFDSARADAQALIDELGPYRKTWEPVADTTLVNRYGPCYWTDPDKNIAYWNSKGYSARVGRRYIEVYVYWLESETMVKRSNDLVERVDAVYATLQQGEADCANGLNGLLAVVCVAPVQAYTAEEIQAYTHDYQMPWGGWEYGTLNWAESTNKAIVDDFLLGTWAGVQSLVGVDPTTGQWSLGTAGQAWLGVGEAVGSLVVATSPLAAVGAALPGKAGDVFRTAQQNVVELGKSLIDYDMWGQDPVRAGWNTALNIGTFFIPTAGAVAGSVKTGLKSASVAMEAGRAADILAGAAKVAGKVETVITAPSRFANDIITKIGRRFDDLNLGDLTIRGPVNQPPVHTPDTPPGHINPPDNHPTRTTDDIVLNDDFEKVSDTHEVAHNRTGGYLGTRPVDPEAGFKWADDAYDMIRSTSDDIEQIARTVDDVKLPSGTVLSRDDVVSLKNHLFFDEHPLTDYETGGVTMGRYDASPEQVEAWQRLVEGDPIHSDLVWLDHEFAEMKYYETHPGASYQEAHSAANQVANWAREMGWE